MLEAESKLKKEKDIILTRNDDLYIKLKKFEEDNMKAIEEIYIKGRELESLKSQLSIADYETEKLKTETKNYQNMINTLTINKEKEISDINNFYNSTVFEQSKILNKVETDQKNII
jgi:hypothetical protein